MIKAVSNYPGRLSWTPLVIPARGQAPEKIFFIFAILAGLLIWIDTFPPMVDLPQHAAQVAMFLRLLHGTQPWAELYRINWLTPYWLGYFLAAILACVVPVVAAIKIIVSVSISLTAICAAYLRREVGGGRAWDWLFLPIGFGFAFDWGFFNFLVGVPVALSFLVFTLAYLRKPNYGRAVAVGVLALALMFCHVLITAFACGMGVLFSLMVAGNIRRVVYTIWPFVIVGPIMLLWWFCVLDREPAAHVANQWDISIGRLPEALIIAVGQRVDAMGAALTILAIGLPFALGARLDTDRRWCVPLALFLAWMQFGPNVLMGNWFTYQRFGIFFLPFYILALRWKEPLPKYANRWAMAAGLIMLTPIAYRLFMFERESADFRSVISTIPPQERVLSGIVAVNSLVMDRPTYVHFGAWYVGLKPGVNEFSFASFLPEIVRFNKDINRSSVKIGDEWNARNYNPAMLASFDYFLVRREPASMPVVNKTVHCDLQILSRNGDWTVYQRGPNGSLPKAIDPCLVWN